MWARSSAALLAAALIGPPPAGSPPRGAISLYETACVRCHGPNGSFYGPELGRGKSDAQLKQAVQEMCDNQGQIEVRPDEAEALTAYHRALIRKEPFVAVTSRTRALWKGEATVGAAVTLTIGGKTLRATRKEFTWQAGPVPPGPVVVTATLAGATVRLDTATASHSHSAPVR